MTHSAEITLERLLSEADWLRRLAGHLVRDPAAADDIVQDTFGAALRRTPSDEVMEIPAARRGWLARVARRTAGRHYRTAQRRSDREEDVAAMRSATEAPSAQHLAERLELQQKVAEALMRVKEPSRSTLYLLFYEGMSAAEVARALDISESTVRSRSMRGREMLRSELVKDGRDWQSWMAALTPWAGAPKAIGLASTGVKVTPLRAALPWLLIGGFAAVTLFVTWRTTRPSTVNRAQAVTTLPDVNEAGLLPAAADENLVPTAAAADGNERVESGAQEESPTAEASRPVLVIGGVKDASDDPAGGVYLTFENETESLQVVSDTENGSFVIPALQSGSWSLSVSSAAYRSQYLSVKVPAAARHRLNIEVEPVLRIPVRFVDAANEPLIGDTSRSPMTMRYRTRAISLEERRGRSEEGARGIAPPRLRQGPEYANIVYPSVVATMEQPDHRPLVTPPGRIQRYGVGSWTERGRVPNMGIRSSPLLKDCQGRLVIDEDPPVWVSLVYGNVVVDSMRIEEAPATLLFEVDQSVLQEMLGTLRFALIDAATGKNVSEEYLEHHPSIRIDNKSPAWMGLEDDRITVYDIAPGPHRLSVGHMKSESALITRIFDLSAGGDTTLPPLLMHKAKPFTVTVRTASGAPVKAFVSAHPLEEARTTPLDQWSGKGSTDAGGSVAISSAPEGQLCVHVHMFGKRLYFFAEINTSEATDLELTVPETTDVRIKRGPNQGTPRFDLVNADGFPVNTLGVLSGTLQLPPGEYSIHRRASETSGPSVTKLHVGQTPITLDPAELR